ncbi:MAG TPA: hypothetical protein VFG79_09535 [Solirubrobacter sp.]|nr:hypothetical protein [Solirubrobacter sp.]
MLLPVPDSVGVSSLDPGLANTGQRELRPPSDGRRRAIAVRLTKRGLVKR